ncbi:MAG: DUF1425 domain-containing protein [Planctomycetota bacterium]
MKYPILKFTSALLLASAALFLTSCDTVKAPHGGGPDTIGPGTYPQIVVLDKLWDYLGFDRPVVTPATDSTPMRVTAPVRLISDANIHIQYQFSFFDAQGRPAGQPGGWRFLTIEARTQRHLEGAALSTQAADWRLEVRSAR